MPLVLMDQGGNRMDIRDDAVGTLRALGHVPLVLMDQGGGVMSIEHDKVGTLRAQTHGHEPLVLQEAYRISSDASNCMRSGNPHSGINKVDLAPTVDTTDPSPSKGQGGIAIVTSGGALPHVFKLRSGCNGGGKGYLGQDDKSFTLATNNDQYLMTEEKVIAPPLTTNNPSRSPRSAEVTAQIASVYQATNRVRKLTPVECERLQGFPDNYTRIPWKGKGEEECPDSPRYKAIGNSWAVPCVRWIGKRIQAELEKNK